VAVENVVKMIFRLLLEGKNVPKEAAEEVGKLDEATKRSRKTADDAKGSWSAFSKSLAGIVTIGAVTAALRSAAAESAELERRYGGVVQQLNAMGLAGERLAPRIRATLEAMQLAGNGLQAETIPAFQKLLGLTGDVNAALYGTKLSADLSDAGFGSVSEGADLLAQILQGRVLSAATRLNVAIRDQNGNLRDSREILQEVIKRWEGYSEKVDDSTSRVDRWKGTFARVWQGLGDQINAVLNAIDGAIEKTSQWGEKFWAFFGDDESARSIAARTMGQTRAMIEGRQKLEAQAALALKETERKAAETTGKEVLEARLRQVEQGSRDQLYLQLRLWQQEKAAAIENAKETGLSRAQIDQIFTERRKGLIADWLKANEAAEEKATQDAKSAADKKAKIEEDRYNRKYRDLVERAKEEAEIEKAGAEAEQLLLEAQRDAAAEGSEERFRLELELLERRKNAALANTKLTEEARTNIEAAYQILRTLMVTAHGKARVDQESQAFAEARRAESDLELAELNNRLLTFRGTLDERAALERRALEVETQERLAELDREQAEALARENLTEAAKTEILAKYAALRKKIRADEAGRSINLVELEKQRRVSAQQAVLAATSQFLGAAFGQSKAIAMAQAVIDAASAIIGIQAHWAWNPAVSAALTALTVATTAAEIAKIASAKPPSTSGKGFDDPVADRAAYVGSQRWGRDFAREMLAGVSMGMRERLGDTGGDTSGGSRTLLADSITRAIARTASVGGGGLIPGLVPAIRSASGGGGSSAAAGAIELDPRSRTELAAAIGEQFRDALRDAPAAAGGGGGDTINLNGPFYGGQEGLRQLKRDLNRMQRLDSNRLVR
jgi:hypothetical protein